MTATEHFHPMLQEMGAEQTFDYAAEPSLFSERLTHCYRLGALAFLNWSDPTIQAFAARRDAPEPRLLVHGSWQAPGMDRIDHCWVVLADDRIWEPITATIYDSDKFYEYTSGTINALHTMTDVHWHLIVSQHWGAWPERKTGE